MMRKSSTPASRSRAPASRPPKPPPIDDHVDLVGERLALERLDVGVVEVVGELARHLDVLLVAVGPQPLVALLAVLVPQRVRVEQRAPSVRHCCSRVTGPR